MLAGHYAGNNKSFPDFVQKGEKDMGSEYRLILMDEFDWCYGDFEKSKLINTRDSILSDDIFVECSIPYMVVISCGRTPAEKILARLKNIGVPFDSAYSQLDNNPSLERITTAST